MKFKLEFNLDNDAFAGSQRASDEIKRILERVGETQLYGYKGGGVVDANGNVIGDWSITEEAA